MWEKRCRGERIKPPHISTASQATSRGAVAAPFSMRLTRSDFTRRRPAAPVTVRPSRASMPRARRAVGPVQLDGGQPQRQTFQRPRPADLQSRPAIPRQRVRRLQHLFGDVVSAARAAPCCRPVRPHQEAMRQGGHGDGARLSRRPAHLHAMGFRRLDAGCEDAIRRFTLRALDLTNRSRPRGRRAIC